MDTNTGRGRNDRHLSSRVQQTKTCEVVVSAVIMLSAGDRNRTGCVRRVSQSRSTAR